MTDKRRFLRELAEYVNSELKSLPQEHEHKQQRGTKWIRLYENYAGYWDADPHLFDTEQDALDYDYVTVKAVCVIV